MFWKGGQFPFLPTKIPVCENTIYFTLGITFIIYMLQVAKFDTAQFLQRHISPYLRQKCL